MDGFRRRLVSAASRALGSRYERMVNGGNSGLAALLTGNTDTAAHAFREELTPCRDLVVRQRPSKASADFPPSP